MTASPGRLLRLLRWWLVYVGPRKEVTVETANGLLTFDSKDWLIGKYLYVHRSFESPEIDGIIARLREEGYLNREGRGCVLDVGANLGMISVALLRRGYCERSIAFEPSPNSYRLLVTNIDQNHLRDRVQHFPYALTSAEGELELEISRDNSGDNRIRSSTARGHFGEERRRTAKVPGKTLDQLLAADERLGKEEFALVWVDIQGYEGHFLAGARQFLKRQVPVVTEFWPYAILRSGMTRAQYGRLVSEFFTHFYLAGHPTRGKTRIDGIDALFETYRGPRQMCQLIFVSDR